MHVSVLKVLYEHILFIFNFVAKWSSYCYVGFISNFQIIELSRCALRSDERVAFSLEAFKPYGDFSSNKFVYLDSPCYY